MNNDSIRDWQFEIHKETVAKGWWSRPEDTVPTKLLMIHAEISEAAEEFARGNMKVWYQPHKTENMKPEGLGVELADAMIRILDLAEYLGMNMDDLITLKMEYNKKRPYRHGGKAI